MLIGHSPISLSWEEPFDHRRVDETRDHQMCCQLAAVDLPKGTGKALGRGEDVRPKEMSSGERHMLWGNDKRHNHAGVIAAVNFHCS